MAQKGRGIFMVYVEIDAQDVQEFNEWYNKEHLPELLSVPHSLSGPLRGSQGWPAVPGML
ncbi:MAG TPA: hypothetical protein VIZ17_20015 [Acetobacteraceae bacterium]